MEFLTWVLPKGEKMRMVKMRTSAYAFFGGLFLIISLVLSGCAASVPQEVEDYLAAHEKPLDLEKPLSDEVFGSSEDYQVFLAGESHSESKNLQAQKMLVRYFYEEKNVRTFLLEAGLGSGVFLDHYLQTGNEDDLKYYMQQLEGVASYTRETYDFYHWLCEYNASLPEDQKLHVVGLDVDHQVTTAAKGLALLMDDSAVLSDVAAEAVRNVREHAGGASLTEFVRIFWDNPDDMRKLFGENNALAEQICQNFEWTAQFYSEEESPANDFRDEVMMANFLFILNDRPYETFFGEFGSEHILQSACETDFGSVEDNRFGMRLDAEGSPVEGKVCSILYAYPKSDLLSNVFAGFGKGVNSTIFESRADADAFFSLDEPGSPFTSGEYLVKGEVDAQATATDFIQKVLVLCDSGATTPYQ